MGGEPAARGRLQLQLRLPLRRPSLYDFRLVYEPSDELARVLRAGKLLEDLPRARTEEEARAAELEVGRWDLERKRERLAEYGRRHAQSLDGWAAVGRVPAME